VTVPLPSLWELAGMGHVCSRVLFYVSERLLFLCVSLCTCVMAVCSVFFSELFYVWKDTFSPSWHSSGC
jgi:hypothetical protein